MITMSDPDLGENVVMECRECEEEHWYPYDGFDIDRKYCDNCDTLTVHEVVGGYT